MASWLPGYCLRALVADLPIGCLVPDKALGPNVGPGLLASLLANCWVQSWAAFELASVADWHASQIIFFCFRGLGLHAIFFFPGSGRLCNTVVQNGSVTGKLPKP